MPRPTRTDYCIDGHPLTPDNIKLVKQRYGKNKEKVSLRKRCRECERLSSMTYQNHKRQKLSRTQVAAKRQLSLLYAAE